MEEQNSMMMNTASASLADETRNQGYFRKNTDFESNYPKMEEKQEEAKQEEKRQKFHEGMQRCDEIMNATPIKQDKVSPQWVNRVHGDGACILDLCAGLATALEAMLKTGYNVRRYIHVDNDPRTKK